MSSPYSDAKVGRRINFPGALFFAAFTAFLAGATALSAYETYSLATVNEPITQRTRYAIAKFPAPAMILTLGLGALLGHLLWGPPGDGEQWWQ